MKRIIILVFAMAATVSCSKNPSDVLIRLSNVSQFDFDNINVSTSTERFDYGALSSGEKSGYKVFEVGYRYAGVSITVEGELLSIIPSDFIDVPLENGSYTYELSVSQSNESDELALSLKFIEE